MKKFLDRVRNGDDDGEEVELSPAAGPAADTSDDQPRGRLHEQVASNTDDEVELSDAGTPDEETADSGVDTGMLPGTGAESGSSGSSAPTQGPASTSADEASIERVIEQNERIISLLERIVDEDTGSGRSTDNDDTDAGGTPQSLW